MSVFAWHLRLCDTCAVHANMQDHGILPVGFVVQAPDSTY